MDVVSFCMNSFLAMDWEDILFGLPQGVLVIPVARLMLQFLERTGIVVCFQMVVVR